MNGVKPCPWCGETNGAVQQTSTFRWRAYVCSCGVTGPEVRVQAVGEGSKEDWEAAARERAIEAWNTRLNIETTCKHGSASLRCALREAEDAEHDAEMAHDCP